MLLCSLYLIIVVLGVFFNPASSAPAHTSYSALRSPDAPAGSAQRPPVPASPACRSICCAPAPRPALRGEIGGVPFWVWERRGLLAAPWWVVFGYYVPAGWAKQQLKFYLLLVDTVKEINFFLPFRKCNRRWGLKVPCVSSHRNPIFNRIAAP